MISGLLPSAEAVEKSLWSLLESIPGAEATAENARHIPAIQTYSGKCRAWIRLALMQKELAEFVAKLVDMDILPQVGCWSSKYDGTSQNTGSRNRCY